MARSKQKEQDFDIEEIDLEELDIEDFEDVDLSDDEESEEPQEDAEDDFDLSDDEDEEEPEEEPEEAPKRRGRPRGSGKAQSVNGLSNSQREWLAKAARKSGAKIEHFSQLKVIKSLMELGLVKPTAVTVTGDGKKALESDGETEAPKRRGRPPKSETKAPSGNGKRGRPKGSGKRAEEALQIVSDEPGITIPDIAEEMGLSSPNYLYRVMPELEEAGKVRKQGKGWHPAGKGSRKRAQAQESVSDESNTYDVEYIADEADVSPRKVRAFIDKHESKLGRFGGSFPQAVADKIVAAL